ncbi:hypothetical protein [Agitococcus lubricus]|uniref:Uncharacterized protein n=1 Tax=Agitococcus lubricus TaxID=1077255 RepID=A0A2T5J1L3_9GAMM|nr:hypothetical protein [Agitococcus lubricus]PTQ90332.1 hypothetical protein C8N29_10385 [Agitococcus lubricus]
MELLELKNKIIASFNGADEALAQAYAGQMHITQDNTHVLSQYELTDDHLEAAIRHAASRLIV